MTSPDTTIKCSWFETETLSNIMKKQIPFNLSFNCYIYIVIKQAYHLCYKILK